MAMLWRHHRGNNVSVQQQASRCNTVEKKTLLSVPTVSQSITVCENKIIIINGTSWIIKKKTYVVVHVSDLKGNVPYDLMAELHNVEANE